MATIDHPSGPLYVIVTCLEHAIGYTDDRVAQATFLAELATRPDLDGSNPMLVMGDLNAAHDSVPRAPLRDVPVDVTTPRSHTLRSGPEEHPTTGSHAAKRSLCRVTARASSRRTVLAMSVHMIFATQPCPAADGVRRVA